MKDDEYEKECCQKLRTRERMIKMKYIKKDEMNNSKTTVKKLGRRRTIKFEISL